MKRRTGGSVESPASGEKTPAAGYKEQDEGPRVGGQSPRPELVGGAGSRTGSRPLVRRSPWSGCAWNCGVGGVGGGAVSGRPGLLFGKRSDRCGCIGCRPGEGRRLCRCWQKVDCMLASKAWPRAEGTSLRRQAVGGGDPRPLLRPPPMWRPRHCRVSRVRG
jgi:hypothetical protein